jgi:hypothetical protein
MTAHCITDDEDDASMEGVPQTFIRKGSSKANPKTGCMTANINTSRGHRKQSRNMKSKAQTRLSLSSIKKTTSRPRPSSSLQKGSGATSRTRIMIKTQVHSYALKRTYGEIPSAGKCQASRSIANVASRKLAPV